MSFVEFEDPSLTAIVEPDRKSVNEYTLYSTNNSNFLALHKPRLKLEEEKKEIKKENNWIYLEPPISSHSPRSPD